MYIFNISVIAIIYLLYIFFLQLVVSFNFISNKYLATHNYVNPPREYIGFEFDGLKEKDGSIYFFFFKLSYFDKWFDEVDNSFTSKTIKKRLDFRVNNNQIAEEKR